jgi:glutamine amidotransferase
MQKGGHHVLAVVDYDAGNLRSVVRAIEHAGGSPTVTSDPRVLGRATAVVLPGVGSAQQAMRRLAELGLDDALRSVATRGVPLLGVCLGLQVLLEHSDEGGPDGSGTACLGILPGTVRRFTGTLKVPHMGWNSVAWRAGSPVFEGIADSAYFYFVHSYYAVPPDEVVAGVADYGVTFCAAIASDNVVATQFHPEKSSNDGLRVYANFLKVAGLCT